jgi:hypothetical protein
MPALRYEIGGGAAHRTVYPTSWNNFNSQSDFPYPLNTPPLRTLCRQISRVW